MHLLGQLLEHSVPFCPALLLYCINILSTVVNNYFQQINDDEVGGLIYGSYSKQYVCVILFYDTCLQPAFSRRFV